jgi:hypothetical protein
LFGSFDIEKSAVWLLDLLERKSLVACAHYEEEFNKQWPRKQREVVERGAKRDVAA